MPLQFRTGNVGGTKKAVNWVNEEFGFNPELLGSLTPQMVQQMDVDSQQMMRQVQMAKVFVKHAESIMKGKVQIEQIRHDLLQSGLAKKEEVDEIVKKTVFLTEKHQGHIAIMLQEMLQGKQEIQAQTFSQKELSENSFTNRLREMRARHRSKMDTQNITSAEKIKSIKEEASADKSEARRTQEEARSFAQYLSGSERARNTRYAIGSGNATSIFAPSNDGKQRQPFGKAGKAQRGGWLGRLFS